MVITYNIKRSLTQNGSLTTIARGLQTKGYVDKTAINNIKYFYVMTIVIDGVEGLNSMQVTATPKRAPRKQGA